MTPQRIFETIVEEHNHKRRTVLCAIVATRGSTPQPSGVLVCVDEAANMIGTLGGGCVEADVRRQAHQQLSKSQGQVLTFKLDSDFGYDDGMICGGQMDIAICPIGLNQDIEPYREALLALKTGEAVVPIRIQSDGQEVTYRIHIEQAPKLYIAGAGHISRVLANLAVSIGFKVHVIDDRADYANDTRFPLPTKVHVGDIATVLKESPIDHASYVVIVTRGHKHDEAALEAVLESKAKYIGMIGSRRKIRVIFGDLEHKGVSVDCLARVHAPIGLNIGAVTSDEIGISIMAQLIQVRRASQPRRVEGPFV